MLDIFKKIRAKAHFFLEESMSDEVERERERSNLWREKIIIKYKIQMNNNRVNIHSYCS